MDMGGGCGSSYLSIGRPEIFSICRPSSSFDFNVLEASGYRVGCLAWNCGDRSQHVCSLASDFNENGLDRCLRTFSISRAIFSVPDSGRPSTGQMSIALIFVMGNLGFDSRVRLGEISITGSISALATPARRLTRSRSSRTRSSAIRSRATFSTRRATGKAVC